MQSLSKRTKYDCNLGTHPGVTWLWFLDESLENKFSMIAIIFGALWKRLHSYIVLFIIKIAFLLGPHCNHHCSHTWLPSSKLLQSNKVTVDSGVETSVKQTYSDSSELLSLSFSSNVLDCSQLWFLKMVLFSITDFQVGIGFLLRKMRLIFWKFQNFRSFRKSGYYFSNVLAQRFPEKWFQGFVIAI